MLCYLYIYLSFALYFGKKTNGRAMIFSCAAGVYISVKTVLFAAGIGLLAGFANYFAIGHIYVTKKEFRNKLNNEMKNKSLLA